MEQILALSPICPTDSYRKIQSEIAHLLLLILTFCLAYLILIRMSWHLLRKTCQIFVSALIYLARLPLKSDSQIAVCLLRRVDPNEVASHPNCRRPGQ